MPQPPAPGLPGSGLPEVAPREAGPPGLEAIRRFFDRPWIRGVRAWLRFFGRGLRSAAVWLGRNAGPMARGIERAGHAAARVSRGAAAVGRSAGRIGGQLGAWGGGGPGGARLRRMGAGLRRFGGRLRRTGRRAEEVAGSVEDLGDALADIAEGDEPERPAPLPEAEAPGPAPSARPRRQRPPSPVPPAAARRLAPPEPPPRAGSAPKETPDGELPAAFRERIRALGKRKRSKPLRRIILDICALREWTTVGELSDWLGMDRSNIQKRHLRPLAKAGRLEARHPGTSHPGQAYRVPGAGPGGGPGLLTAQEAVVKPAGAVVKPGKPWSNACAAVVNPARRAGDPASGESRPGESHPLAAGLRRSCGAGRGFGFSSLPSSAGTGRKSA